MQRFEKLWDAWERQARRDGPPTLVVSTLSDEDLIGLLAGAPTDRRLERNVLATEAINRLAAARRGLVEATEAAANDLAQLMEVVSQSAVAAAERDNDPIGYDERNSAREAALEHLRATEAVVALERTVQRMVVLRDVAIAHAGGPDPTASSPGP